MRRYERNKMLFTCVKDFYKKADCIAKLSENEESFYATKMKNGDLEAREKLIFAYLPTVAGYVKRLPEQLQTLDSVYRFIGVLEKAVDGFDFLQDSEPFIHRLSLMLKQSTASIIADKN